MEQPRFSSAMGASQQHHRRRLVLLEEQPRAGGLAGLGSLAGQRRSLGAVGQKENCEQIQEARNINLQRTSSSDSTDSGCCMDSPPLLGIKDFDETFRLPMRRMHSLPNLLGCSPALKRSHSDLLDCDGFQSCSPEENKENESFEFKKPMKPASRSCLRMSSLEDEKRALGLKQKSAAAFMFCQGETSRNGLGCFSPAFLRQQSRKTSETENDDDGFLEILDGQDVYSNEEMSPDVASLWTAPLVMKKGVDTHNKQYRLLSVESEPYSMAKPALKRTERSQEEHVPGAIKRRRNVCEAPAEELMSVALVGAHLSSLMEIESVLDRDPRNLIGDFSKDYLLHTVDGKHQDLKYIDPEMIVAVLKGSFSRFIKECVIIDCRYPYEYEGGHIQGAINLHMEEDVEEFLLKKPIVPSGNQRVIIVFHCEFSSERAPRMCRFVRERDRLGNEYPSLHYPELYVLKGGYKDFFLKYRNYCEPQNYRPMHHEDFKEDFRKFRTKSRTWAGDLLRAAQVMCFSGLNTKLWKQIMGCSPCEPWWVPITPCSGRKSRLLVVVGQSAGSDLES
ncbi:M-phase inducer phosphatase 1 isoform X2 [Hemicordylus capensis]|uniref:M-phase inducer phosphatase 1 isoform X2 n=1 Tax=Hemicordylus capensis TaxID=884348 RepID=UPI002302AB37|nr:M-phase inducer phosphatase 1 isoform X2 [Hemicordylus capensis]